jgi:hypothetical protein
MRKILTAAAALLLSASAHAAPLVLDPSPSAQARAVVNVVFAPYLATRVGASVETAVVDLDKNGVGEIVARFVHSGSCTDGMKSCRTVVLRHDGNAWKIVFDHSTSALEVLEGNNGVPAPLRADRITWSWEFPTYAPTADGVGKPVDLSDAAPALSKSLAPAFGEGAAKLATIGGDYRFGYASPKLSAKDEFIAVRMAGQNICGLKTGCPVRLLKKGKDGWATVLATSTKDSIYVGNSERDGYRDVVISTDKGFTVYGWNGEKYAVADRVEAPGKDSK